MRNDGSDGKATSAGESSEKHETSGSSHKESVKKDESIGSVTAISIVISRPDSCSQTSEVSDLTGNGSKATGDVEKGSKVDAAAAGTASKKSFLLRSDSYEEQCRVCHEQTEETLMDLGCQCRGELGKAHRSCIELWFRTRGSNKCEICQQVAVNVPNPESQRNGSYWIWRIDPSFRGSNFVQTERGRGCLSPLWVAFSILIGGLLLDVLISISLGVSAVPVNIIIGVLVVLGLGTALRLTLECCHEWSLRRSIQRVDANIAVSYPPAV